MNGSGIETKNRLAGPEFAPGNPDGPLPLCLTAEMVSLAYKHYRKDLTTKKVLASLGHAVGLSASESREQLRRALDQPAARRAKVSANGFLERPGFEQVLYRWVYDVAAGERIYAELIQPALKEGEELLFLDPKKFEAVVRAHRPSLAVESAQTTLAGDEEALALFALAFGLLQPADASAIVDALCVLGPGYEAFMGVDKSTKGVEPSPRAEDSITSQRVTAASDPSSGAKERLANSSALRSALEELRSEATELGALLADAAGRLSAEGVLPARELVVAIGNLRRGAEDLVSEIRAAGVLPEAEPDSPPSLAQLEEALNSLENGEELRRQAMALLETVKRLRSKSGGELPASGQFFALLRETERLLAPDSPAALETARALVNHQHPLAQLLSLVASPQPLTEEEVEQAFAAVSSSLGLTMARAADKGKLTVEAVAETPPPGPTPEPEHEKEAPVDTRERTSSGGKQSGAAVEEGLPAEDKSESHSESLEGKESSETSSHQQGDGVLVTTELPAPPPEPLSLAEEDGTGDSLSTRSPVAPGDDELSPKELEEQGRKAWESLAQGRMDVAYQMARCLEELTPAKKGLWLVPDLPRLCLLAPHLRSGSPEELTKVVTSALQGLWTALFADSSKIVAAAVQPTALLALAASLRPALLSPQTSARDLLREAIQLPDGLSGLHRMKTTILDFSRLGLEITEPLLRGAQQHAIWEQQVVNRAQAAREWLDKNRQGRIIYAPTTDVWLAWLAPGGPLGKLFEALSERRPQGKALVETELAKWKDSVWVRQQIERTDQSIRGRKAKLNSIEARALTSLAQHAGDALGVLRNWLDVLSAEPAAGSADFFRQQIEQLRADLLDASGEARGALHHLATAHSSREPLGAASCAALMLVKNLEDLLTGGTDPAAEISTEPLLNGVLLRLTDISLDAKWKPQEQSSRTLLSRLNRLGDESPEEWCQVFAAHATNGDHRATGRILEVLSAQAGLDDLVNELGGRRNRDLEEGRRDLGREVEEARLRLNRAVVNDAIPPADQLDLTDRLDRVQWKDAELLADEREKVRDVIARVADFQVKQASSVRTRLLTEIPNASEELRAKIELSLSAGDLVTANELIDFARDGKEFERASEEDLVARFFPGFLRGMGDLLRAGPDLASLRDSIRRGRSSGSLDTSRLLKEQAESAGDLLDAWYKVKLRPRAIGGITSALQSLFQTIGLLGCKVDGPRLSPDDRIWWGSLQGDPIVDRSVCAVPDFGSQAKGHYALLCVWDRIPEQDLLRIIDAKQASEPVLVLVFSVVPEQPRRDLASLCRARRKRVLLFDEALAYFLCTVVGSRLQALFRCTLPFTVNDPYTTTASFLPPEMFFGRSTERQDVISPTGTNLVFGGRQLGKTALLREVQRRYDHPAAGTIVRWLDLKNEGIGTFLPIEDLWRLLAGELEKGGLQRIAHPNREVVAEKVKKWLGERPNRRIVLLLDEADVFLANDSERHFEQLGRLKQLMEETGRAFKVVFAGLHNVQRMSRDPNSPIGHLGSPVCIGPLIGDQAREALDLVTVPLRDLGYRFASSDLPLRIVAYCNYYPSLIQVYCKHLLAHLNDPKRHSVSPRQGPPHFITVQDLDVVENVELRVKIREKFRLTLDLDPRYRVIALCLALAAFEPEANGEAQRGVDPDWVLRQSLYWWPEGFEREASRERVAILLDEMVGLGVLRQVVPQRYALRTPNLAVLLGTKKDIEDQLLDAGSQVPAAPYEAGLARRGKPSELWLRSPLTAEQEGIVLGGHAVRVAIVFGSSIAGLDSVEEFVRLAAGDSEIVQLSHVLELNRFTEGLREAVPREAGARVLCLVPASSLWSGEWVSKALEFVEKGRGPRLPSTAQSVLFIGGADHAWNWCGVPDLERTRMRDRGVRELTLRPWADATVRRWLQDVALAGGEAAQTEAVRKVTGNWRELLNEFFNRCGRGAAKWQDHLAELGGVLEKDSALLARFDLPPGAAALLQPMAEYGEPMTAAEIVHLAAPATFETCTRMLEALELLAYVSRGIGETWQLDPVLLRAVTTRS